MFNRSVLMHDGTTRRLHEAVSLTFEAGRAVVDIRSWEAALGEGNPLDTWLAWDTDDDSELEAAEEWAATQEAFSEHEDPYAEAVEDMREHAEQQAALIDSIAEMLDDESAATVPQAFREWEPDTDYVAGDRRRYENVLYKCLQPHTSQSEQAPDVAVSLWARILNPDPEVISEWEQPDSTNPYMKGDKVTHNGHAWVSDIDYNVFEPGVAGWTQLD